MSSEGPNKFERFFWGGGEEGTVFYSRNIAPMSWPALDSVKHRLASVLDKIPFSAKGGRPFIIADYGCRDGGVLMPAMRHLIECLRQNHGFAADIHIMYEDHPYCDFKSLFLMANGLSGTEYDSAWSRQDGVYFSAVGRSFFEQCLPSNSVHVGMSSHAVMYLSTRPCVLPHDIIYALSKDAQVKSLYAKQGARDWETFLLRRNRELVPGGIIYVVAFYTTEDGEYQGATKSFKNKFETMHSIWKELYREGRITKEELQEPTFNHYFNTVDEFKAPLTNKASPVHREGLRLLSLETKTVPCVFQGRFKKVGKNDEAAVAMIAHDMAKSFRTWGSGDFLAALSSRLEPERMKIVDELFRRLEAQFRAEPTRHANELPIALMMMQKMIE